MLKSTDLFLKLQYLYIFIALIPIVIGIIGFRALLNSPYTGLHFEQRDDKWYVSSIDSDSPVGEYSELIGAEVMEIAGWKLNRGNLALELNTDIVDQKDLLNFFMAQKYFNERIYVNTPFPMVFISKGTNILQSIDIVPVNYPLLRLIEKSSLILLCACITIFIGILLLIKKPKDSIAQVFALMALSTSLVDITYIISMLKEILLPLPIYVIIDIVNNFSTFYIATTFLHFTTIFPQYRITLNKFFFIPIIYICATIGCIIYLTRISFYPYPVLLLFYTAIGFVFIIHSYLTLQSPILKAQLRLVLISMSLCTIIFLIFYLIPLFTTHENVSAYWPMISTILVPLSIAFAIMRYKLMDIDNLFDNTLIYGITIGLLAIIDVILIYILTSNKIPLLRFNTTVSTIIAVWVIIFTYLPVRNLVQKQIKKMLKREIYDTNAISMKLSQELISIFDIQSALDKAITMIESALHPKGNSSILLNQHGSIVTENSWLTREQLNTVSSPIHLYQLGNMDALPKNYAGGICVPIIGTQRSLGYLILQDKHSERLYDKEDVKLLSIISAQLAMAIEAIMAREEKEWEKEKISREIHDGLGSTFSKAKLLIANVKLNGGEALEELENTIDDGLKDIRELLWAVEKEENTLSDVVFYIQDKLKHLKNVINIDIQVEIDNEDIVIPPNIKLNTVRVVQEAITNAIKHAQATNIGISFIQHDDSLVIRITDNGTGFDTDLPTHKHYGLRNMKKRCAEIGGELEIVSKNGEGTEIRAIIKL